MSHRSEYGPRHDPVNVRGDLVGGQDAEQLDVANDRTTALSTMVLGAVMVLMAVVVLVQAARLDNGDQLVGPATAPWVVGILLFVVGAALVVRGRRDMGFWEAGDHTTSQDWTRMGILLVVLVVFSLIINLVGYVVAATLLFGTTSIVLGSPLRLRPYAYGFCVAALVFLAFDVLIGITLPAGPWGF